MRAAQKHPPGWDQFLRRAKLFFRGETPSGQTRAKLMSRFEHGLLTTRLLDILDRLRSMPERYDSRGWWAGPYRPPFRVRSRDPREGFVPSKMRQLARDPLRFIALVRAYIEHHRVRCRAKLSGLDRDLVADIQAAGPCLAWAASRPDPLYGLLVEAPRVPEFRPVPAWPRFNEITRLLAERHPPGIDEDVADLRERAAREMHPCRDRLAGDALAGLGLDAMSDEERQGRDAEVARLRSEVAWCDESIEHLDGILAAGGSQPPEEETAP